MSSPKAPEKLSFEQALEKLQLTVKRLESGELSLEQALQSFEEGMKLSAACQEQLKAAEQRVEILMKGTGEGGTPPGFEPFPSGK
jgi:exodeoxyribonuclease VII small subunit